MVKNILLGAVLPILFTAAGIGAFVGLKRPQPQRNPPLGQTPAELLKVLPIANVDMVRPLKELSNTLDISVNGLVVPYRELLLAAEVSGRVVEEDARIRSGSYVTKGQVLYRIDPRDYELEVQRLSRKRSQEEAALRELEQDIVNAEQLVQVAEDEFALAEAELARYERLGGNVASAAELDQVRRSRLSSMNQKLTIQNQLSALKARKTRLELAIKLAETELEQAELDLERTVIRSPVSGRIVTENVEADSFVQRGTQLVTIEDTEKVEVAVNVRMDQLFWILDQQAVSADELVSAATANNLKLPKTPVKVRFAAGDRNSRVYQWEGVLDRYDGAGLDAQSRTVPIRIMVDEPSEFRVVGSSRTQRVAGPPMLVRGMFVEAIVQASPATPLVLVPKLSVKPATSSYQIWCFRPDDDAMHHSAEAKRSRQRKEENGGSEPAAPSEQVAADDSVKVDPAEWQAGYLEILRDVHVVGAFEPPEGVAGTLDSEYTICEVPQDALAPGDLVITTPLPGVEDLDVAPVRVPKSDMVDAPANGKEANVSPAQDSRASD